jgi:hypothetical protein
MNTRLALSVLATSALFVLAACGSDSTVFPTPVASPVPGASTAPATVPTQPVPTPAPTPVPTPAPNTCTQGLCEDPTTNTDKVVRLTIRVYAVTDKGGVLQGGFGDDSVFPLGYKVTIDATAKDSLNRDTLGTGDVKFFFDDPALVNIGGNHNYQRKLEVLQPGTLKVWASLDGISSNVLTLRLGN